MSNNNEFVLNLSKWMNKYVKENNLDVKDMAKKLECSESYINVILDYPKYINEYGEHGLGVSMEFLMKISNTYNVKIDTLFNLKEKSKIDKA